MQQARASGRSILKSDWGVYLSFPKKKQFFAEAQ